MALIKQIYGNHLGMAFYWNRSDEDNKGKIQLVFKETGFNLTLSELEYFSKLIIESETSANSCADCKLKKQCGRYLLQTPAKQIDLAVSIAELEGIQDLVDGTIFKIKLQNHIFGIGRN